LLFFEADRRSRWFLLQSQHLRFPIFREKRGNNNEACRLRESTGAFRYHFRSIEWSIETPPRTLIGTRIKWTHRKEAGFFDLRVLVILCRKMDTIFYIIFFFFIPFFLYRNTLPRYYEEDICRLFLLKNTSRYIYNNGILHISQKNNDRERALEKQIL